jgi:hypothetical protein
VGAWVQGHSCTCLLLLYKCAISGTRGSSGLGSVSSEQMDSSTLLIVKAGLLQVKGESDELSAGGRQRGNSLRVHPLASLSAVTYHWSFKMSRQIPPLLLIFGW